MNNNTPDPASVLPDDLIEMRPAAQLARCHLSTLYRLIGVGRSRPPKLRAWKRSGRYFVSRAELLGLFKPVEPKAGKVAEPAPTAVQERAYREWVAATLARAKLLP